MWHAVIGRVGFSGSIRLEQLVITFIPYTRTGVSRRHAMKRGRHGRATATFREGCRHRLNRVSKMLAPDTGENKTSHCLKLLKSLGCCVSNKRSNLMLAMVGLWLVFVSICHQKLHSVVMVTAGCADGETIWSKRF